MKKSFFSLLTIIVFSLFFTGCKNLPKEESTNHEIKNTFENDITSIVNKMSTREKIGQVMLMNFRFWDEDEKPILEAKKNRTPLKLHNQKILNIIKNYHIGSVILFSESLTSEENAKLMIEEFQNTSKLGNNLPLLISIDQEGGTVNNLLCGTAFPSAMAIGKTGDTENAYLVGNAIAKELQALGFNCDFAPDCDVNSNIANPVIGLRSYGEDANTVKSFSVAMAKGLKDGGVIACAKHFPGHGDTATDSHHGLPKIKKSKSAWEKCDLIPFKNAIDSSIPMIMSAHIQYPSLDNSKIKSSKTNKNITRPATLSKKILTDVLRGELNFNGVVVTDALDMSAITNNFTPSEATIEAINAGADLLCHPINIYCNADLEKCENFFTTLEKYYNENNLQMKRLNEAVCRVLTLKKKYGILSVNKADKNLLEKINFTEHKNLSYNIEKSAITKNKNFLETPFKIKKNDKILFILSYKDEVASFKNCVLRLQEKGKILENTTCTFYCYEKETDVTLELKEKIKDATHIIFETTLTGYAVKNPKLWNCLTAKKIGNYIEQCKKIRQTVVVSNYLPYEKNILPQFNIYNVYNYKTGWALYALEPIFGITLER